MSTGMNALVTGVGRGLGHELAKQLVATGHRVWGSIRPGRVGHAADLNLAGLVEFDQADESAVVAAAAELAQQTDSLDLLINCAGADARAFGAADDQRRAFDVEPDAFTSLLRSNVVGPMLVTRELLPLLRHAATARGHATVLNISSQLGSMQAAANMGRDTAYCVSKAALNMWSVKAAAELRADKIGVVMIHPGWVQTDMGGDEAPMTIPESAAAVIQTATHLTLADSGRFMRWDGIDHPW